MGRRKTRLVFGVWSSALLMAVFAMVLNIPAVRGIGVIIRADGSVDPPDAPIQRDGYLYTFMGNINGSIGVQRSSIVIDGNGYVLQGSGTGYGFYLTSIDYLNPLRNVTIKRTNIEGFYVGIYIYGSPEHVIFGNNITGNYHGVEVSASDNNTFLKNNIVNNDFYGIGVYSSYNTISENNVANNTEWGVWTPGSNNTISRNIVTNSSRGLYVSGYFNNVHGNNVRNNTYGITLGARGSVLRNNTMSGNQGGSLFVDDLIQDIDPSNTIDGKPVYYLVNRQNVRVPADAGYVALVNSCNITVRGLELTNNHYGLIVANTTNSLVENSNFINNWSGGIYLSRSSSNNTFAGNNIENTEQGYGVLLDSSSNNTFLSNNIEGNNLAGVVGGSYGGGVFLSRNSTYNHFWANNITENRGPGFELYESSFNSIRGNNVSNNNGYGASLSASSNNSISGNAIIDNGWYGVHFSSSHNNTVSRNIIRNDTVGLYSSTGIFLSYSANNSLSENVVSGYVWGIWDIWSGESAGHNIIRDNAILDNIFGIWVNTRYNSISNNMITHNELGIRMSTSASDNKIYHNNIINNTSQAIVDGILGNVWDDSYPLGGNYWSDYTGSDEKSGPDQTEPGSDGIGDTPYIICSDNVDRYPLVSPLDTRPPTTTHDYDGLWHTADFTITLTAVDDVSGVAETYYIVNGGQTQNVSAHGQPLISTESSDNRLMYWSVDESGKDEFPRRILTGIKLDKTAPSGYILINDDDASTTELEVTLNLWASDATSGVSQMRFSNDGTNWTAWEPYAISRSMNLSSGEGTKTIHTQYRDVAGLVSPTYNDTIMLFDLDSPTTAISLSGVKGSNDWFTSDATVTLSAADEISEIDRTEYSFDNIDWFPYTTPFNITEEGSTPIYYKSVDTAGNIESTKTHAVKIDKSAPSGSIVINEGNTYSTSASVTLALSASDNTSGIYQVRYSNDGIWDDERWEDPVSVKVWTLTLGDGTRSVYFQIKDAAGLISITYSDTVILDSTPPGGWMSLNEGATYTTKTSVTLTLLATDATSGVAAMRFSDDNTTYADWQTYGTSKPWTLQEGDGIKTVYVQFKDQAGLISTFSDTIILDTTKPTGSIAIIQGAAYTNSTSATLSLSATDATSGVAQMRFSNDNVTWSDWEAYATSKSWTLLTGDGAKGVTVQYKDNAGLTSSYSDSIILDTTKPTANAGVDQIVNEDTQVTFDASASTDENDIATYTWDFGDGATGTGKVTTHTYGNPGTYTAALTVKDPAGNTATGTVTMTVLDVTKPVTNAGSDRTVNEDTQITFDGSASSDNVAITAYTWTFTDATTKTLAGQKPTYTFNAPGVYAITLNVTDSAGNWATDTVTVTVLDITKPVANAGQNQTANAGAIITFDASDSTDNVGIISYEWNFGDGATGTGKTATHTYAIQGTYTAALTVEDSAGNSATGTVTVTVLPGEAPPPPAEALPTWIIGAAIVAIGIAVAATLLWRRRK